jgi:hypothetical protein
MSTQPERDSGLHFNDEEAQRFIDHWCPIHVRAYIARLAAGTASNSEPTPDLFLRIEAAITRVTRGEGTLRVPVDDTDPDIVLAACRDQLIALQRQLAEPRTESSVVITTEMVREALAHCPIALSRERTAIPRWERLATYLTNALADPDKPCDCCGVTPAGDVTDHLDRNRT